MMNRRVALLGASLSIDSIAAALAGAPGLELLRFEYPPSEGSVLLQTLDLDAMIFDIAAGLPDKPFLELMAHPGLLLLGFDLKTQRMLLFSGEPARLLTREDLLTALSVQDGSSQEGGGQS